MALVTHHVSNLILVFENRMMFCRPRSLIGLHSTFVLGEKNFSGRHLQFVLREAKMSSTVDKMSGYQQAAKLVVENTIPKHVSRSINHWNNLVHYQYYLK
jgi:hypothetical protein